MNDDAIAPVVAVMMILVVAVTLLSIWNAIYLPDLKQQAEVEHLKEVEEGFREIDSDISHMVSLNRSGIVKVSIPLGGGDIMLHQAKSGGTLALKEPYVQIKVYEQSDPTNPREAYILPIQYTPVSNFWVNQGYTWGTYLNVSKGSVTTPLEFGQMDDVEVGHYIRINTDSNPISIAVLNLTQGEPSSVSGNGIATIYMDGEPGPGLLLNNPVYIKVNMTPLSGKKINDSVYSKLNSYWFAEGEYHIMKDVLITRYNLTLSVR